jgi:hypothetical protein
MAQTGFQGECFYCRQPVYGVEGVAYGVVGWEGVRAQGGANQIIMRTRVDGKVAHLACARHQADLAKRGIAPDQAVLDFG